MKYDKSDYLPVFISILSKGDAWCSLGGCLEVRLVFKTCSWGEPIVEIWLEQRRMGD